MSYVKPKDLIHEIKIRPGIFNKEVLEQPRREHKHQLWLEVAENLTPPDEWESYTDLEKEARVDEIASKWKHMRANFHRELKLLEAGEAAKKRRYLYFEDMEFIRPFVGQKMTSVSKTNSLDGFEDNDTDIEMEVIRSNESVDKDEPSNNVVEGVRARPKRLIKPTVKAMQNKPSSSTSVINRSQKEAIIKNFDVLKKTSSGGSGGNAVNPTFKIRDGDISFCLSLVPTLRKLGDGRKLRAKIEILKVLHRYVDHIERRTMVNRSVTNHKIAPTNSKQNANTDEDIGEDNLEEYDDGFNVKREQHDDPLNSSGGNTKTWWT